MADSSPGGTEAEGAAPARYLTPDEWYFWFHHIDEVLELRGLIGRQGVAPTISNPLREEALRALRAAAFQGSGPNGHERGAALLALARCTTRETDTAALSSLVNEQEIDSQLHATAVFSLGLLRRANTRNRFKPSTYIAVRRQLLDILGTESIDARVRGSAALALGSLGDMPFGEGDDASKAISRRLMAMASQRSRRDAVAIGSLWALGLQPRASIDAAQRARLVKLAQGAKRSDAELYSPLRAYPVLALGRFGTRDDLRAIEAMDRPEDPQGTAVLRSIPVAWATLLPRLAREDQVVLLRRCMAAAAQPTGDECHRQFATVAVVHAALAADLAGLQFPMPPLVQLHGLLGLASRGPARQRPLAAIALAILLRRQSAAATTDPTPNLDAFIARTRRYFLARLRSDGHPHRRSGFALALGIAGWSEAQTDLERITTDTEQDPTLRGYCELALAELATRGSARSPAIGAGRRMEARPRHRLLSTRALGVAPTDDSIRALEKALYTERTLAAAGEAARSLARIGSQPALRVLMSAARNPEASSLTRACAYAGIARLLDQGDSASLARLRAFVNYRACNNLIFEMLSIL